jgi:hypothetical protein
VCAAARDRFAALTAQQEAAMSLVVIVALALGYYAVRFILAQHGEIVELREHVSELEDVIETFTPIGSSTSRVALRRSFPGSRFD